MDLIQRSTCVFSGAADLEPLHTFKDFPIFMGCTTSEQKQDKIADMSWWISRTTGSIQLNPLIPLDVLYEHSHNDAVGSIWADHHERLSQFVAKFGGKAVLEIGGANGLLAQKFFKNHPNKDLEWTILEPNPVIPDDLNVQVIKGFVTNSLHLDTTVDTIVHSHVFEHTYSPVEFLRTLRRLIKPGDRHIFSLPNMRALLAKYYTNCLNFEHTCFLTESTIEWALQQAGFKVLATEFFREDHSIFYATEATDQVLNLALPNQYNENKRLFEAFLAHNEEIVEKLNKELREIEGPVYLFGAHLFSQYLISWGLNLSKIIGVLDNSPMKIGQRLYGTSLMVSSPEVLKGIENPTVILRAANYSAEIKSAILRDHNSNVRFME
jgi:2-polyprenyl-3-methyl-5-hydroxy-6-metoxy-1,4-benzoquinol methylase